MELNPVFGKRIALHDMDSITNFIQNIGYDIEKNSNKNKHMKSLLQESKKDLVDMMDESYQDAFNIEIQKGK